MNLFQHITRGQLSIGILAILHVVGMIGMMTAWQAWFVMLTPFTLLISMLLLLFNHREWNRGFVIVALLCLVVGFGIEVAGVQTGVIFGEYSYGQTLGWKWLGVPLIMAVNWLILVYCTGVITQLTRWPLVAKAALAALMMTGLDVLIEPVAIRFDYWSWGSGTPPLLNYLAWFAVSFCLLAAFHGFRFDKRNNVGIALYIIQLIFFAVLNLIP